MSSQPSIEEAPPPPGAAPAACLAPAEPRGAIGYGRPPAGRPFRPGVSGNPLGRPRRVALVQAGARRVIPAEPSELERALAEPVFCLTVDASEPVSLARAVVSRLTQRALDVGDVAACRELLRLCAEAAALGAERELLAAEADDADVTAREAREQAAADAAAEAAERARQDARDTLAILAREAAEDVLEPELDDDDRALNLLGAVELKGAEVAAVRPWVVEVAQAHDPALPRAGHRPIDLADPWDALRRLDILREDEDGENALAAWFIDAARARSGAGPLAPGDEALLALVRAEDGEDSTDWEARLRAVEAAAETTSASSG